MTFLFDALMLLVLKPNTTVLTFGNIQLYKVQHCYFYYL